METIPRYQYQRLAGNDSFRLLHLIPNIIGFKLQCLMEEVSLSNLTGYNYLAMSYTWGSPDDKTSIPCGSNGEVVMIPRNLYAALLCLATEPWQGSLSKTGKPMGYSIWIWADAICIDQSSLAERSQQVQLMRQIYQSAASVLVWLGPRVDADQGLIELIDGLYKRLSDATKGQDPHRLDLVALKNAGLIPGAASEDWVRLGNFYQEAWFTRKWVIQEVASAKNIGLMKGPLVIPWEPLWRLPELLVATNLIGVVKSAQLDNARLRNTEGERKLNGIRQAYIMSLQRVNLQRGNPANLFELLCRFRDSLATEQKDHVFALVGISSDGDHPAYQPDYTREVEDVYREVAWTAISQYSSLHILSAAGLQDGIANLPSWTPDWTVSPQVLLYGLAFPATFQASARTKGVITHKEGDVAQSPHYRGVFSMLKAFIMHHSCPTDVPTPGYACLSSNNSILTVLGKIVAVVDKLGTAQTQKELLPQLDRPSVIPDWVISGWTAEQLQRLYSQLAFGENLHAEAEALAQQQSTYPSYISGGSMHEAFWRTLICNTTPTGERVPDSYANYYRSWRAVAGMLSLPENHFHSIMAEHSAPGMVYDEIFGITMPGRRFFTAREGYIGLAPSRTRAGDVVCVIKGANVPFILRPRGENRYVLVGECYCHGIMHGEVMLRKDLDIQEISLV